MPAGFGQRPAGIGPFGGGERNQPDLNPAGPGFGFGGFGGGMFGFAGGVIGGDQIEDNKGWSGNVARDVVVFAGMEGPQIVLNWRLTEGHFISRLRIYRQEREYATATTDPEAVLVYDTGVVFPQVDVTAFADTTVNAEKLGADPTPGTWYYYRIFTESAKLGLPPQYDYFDGGSEGFALAYEMDDFDNFVWTTLLPEVWAVMDARSRQARLTTYVEATTDEHFTLVEPAVEQGVSERFVRILAMLFRRLFVHADETWQTWDLQRVRADALDHIATTLGIPLQSSLVPGRTTYNTWRRDLQDAVYQYRLKGTEFLNRTRLRQVTGVKPSVVVEMAERVQYAWDPQNPDAIDGGLTFRFDSEGNDLGGNEARRIEEDLDTNTYCWGPTIESPYNERGVRAYFKNPLDEDSRVRLRQEIARLKPGTVTFEIWEANRYRARET